MLNLLGAFAVGGSIGFVIACVWLTAFDRRDQTLAGQERDAPNQLPS